MYKSIVHSCDTYYYMLANDMGIDNIAKFMGSLGLGQRTGVDLGKDDSGESKGVLPSQEWKKQRFKKPEQQKWYAGETISIGIGQGYNAYTPIQLAQATAVVANNGVMFRPHLVQPYHRRQDRRKAPGRAASRSATCTQAAKRRRHPPRHGRRQQGRHRCPGLRRRALTRPAGKTGTAQVFR
jgi:cell division protein FtsI/penicillin-binding protein 2